MERTYGTRQMTKPEGMLREVHWPSMARMDQRTGDGRLLMSSGGGVRDLPRTFFFQFAQAMGHEGAVPVGRVDQVTLHDDGNVSGFGWLADTEDGRKAATFIATKMQRHNSVDLADIKAKIDITEDFEINVDFTEWKIGATTGVAKPAFADAEIELTDEMMASIFSDDAPLVIESTEAFEIVVDLTDVEIETKASGPALVAWDDFHMPESDQPHKIIVDEDGRVYGHLAMWDTPHRGYTDRLRVAPRGNYADYNQPGPLTEKGFVGTGPVFLLGGHPTDSVRGMNRAQVHAAYGGIENTWADVRVSEGKHGPWVSGRVRPGVSDEMLYAARASHISGHWLGDELVAIVSCNVPGFKPGAGFAAVEDGRLVELVASFPAEPEEKPQLPPLELKIESTNPFITALQQWNPNYVWGLPTAGSTSGSGIYTITTLPDAPEDPEADSNAEVRFKARKLAIELDNED